MRYWYVFNIFDGRKPHWHARDSLELASLCRPKRRLRTFRRGPGARRYTCCAVKTLEQFRNVVLDHLAHEDSKLRTGRRPLKTMFRQLVNEQERGAQGGGVGHDDAGECGQPYSLQPRDAGGAREPHEPHATGPEGR